jgi:hypothetical protein
MVEAFHLYLDESGPRHPDKKIGRAPLHGYDWFGMGGVLLKEEDENYTKQLKAIRLLKKPSSSPRWHLIT